MTCSFLRWRAAVAAALSLVSFTVGAADEAAVVVTASREPALRHRLAADVVVIDAERIRASGADSLEDLLRREAGLQLVRNGAPGQNAGLLMRGASSGQTLLLIDGVRVGSATLGAPELDLLSLASIERVEVLRGPGSSLYGADAIGGVVQVFTRRGSGAPRVALRLAGGGYGAREGSLAADAKAGAIDLAAGVSHERLGGVSVVRPGDAFGNHNPDADGYTRRGATVQLGVTPAPGRRLGLTVRESRLDAQYDGSEFLPPSFAQDASADFRSRSRMRQAVLDGAARLGEAWQLSARVADDRSDRTLGANAPERFRTERQQALAQASWRGWPGQQFTLALERVDEAVQSSSYAADAERSNDAIVLAYAGSAGPLAVQAEARRDRNSAYGRSDTGRLGLRWPLAAALSLRALAGNSFRAPSFNDLVFPNYGVPTLRPERGRSVEAGIDARIAGAELAFTVYRQDLRQMIAYEPDPALCPPDPAYAFGCARNVQSARLQGATLSLATAWTGAREGWQLRATVDTLDAKDRASGARLPRRAAHQESLALRWRGGAWEASAEALHVGARPDSGVVLPAESTLDLLAAWRLAPGWQLQAKLLNATDVDRQPLRDYQDLGRQAWLVLRWEGAW